MSRLSRRVLSRMDPASSNVSPEKKHWRVLTIGDSVLTIGDRTLRR